MPSTARSATAALAAAMLFAGAFAVAAAPRSTRAQMVRPASPRPGADRLVDQPFDAARFSQTFSHHTAVVNGIRMHYVIGGRGEPLVLLHGWPETWYAWRKVMPALAERYTVIVPDQRGIGDTDKPASGYDKRTVSDDVYQLVRQLGYTRINLVGHDWGGNVAYAYTAAHRDGVRALAIVDVVVADSSLLNRPLLPQSLRGAAVPPFSSLFYFPFQASRDLPELLVEGKERQYLSFFYQWLAWDKSAINSADLDEYTRALTTPGALRASFEWYRALFDDVDYFARQGQTKLTMPVLALGGEHSYGTAVAENLRNFATNVTQDVVPDCGHWVAEERPEYAARRLLEFFGAPARVADR